MTVALRESVKRATAFFTRHFRIVDNHEREERLKRSMSEDEIRSSTTADLAARLRMRRKK